MLTRLNLATGIQSCKNMLIYRLRKCSNVICSYFIKKIIFFPLLLIHLQEKPKMGTMESLKFLVSSRYIRDLATLVVAYGISINLVEVTWKSKLKAQVNLICLLHVSSSHDGLTNTMSDYLFSPSLNFVVPKPE